MSEKRDLKGGSLSEGAKCAEEARKERAGSYKGGKPPSGPKAEPNKLNGVPLIREKGVSGR